MMQGRNTWLPLRSDYILVYIVFSVHSSCVINTFLSNSYYEFVVRAVSEHAIDD